MLFQAPWDLDIDLGRSWMIGDKLSDIEAGLRAGVSPILVHTGHGEKEGGVVHPGFFEKEADVLSAVRSIETSCFIDSSSD